MTNSNCNSNNNECGDSDGYDSDFEYDTGTISGDGYTSDSASSTYTDNDEKMQLQPPTTNRIQQANLARQAILLGLLPTSIPSPHRRSPRIREQRESKEIDDIENAVVEYKVSVTREGLPCLFNECNTCPHCQSEYIIFKDICRNGDIKFKCGDCNANTTYQSQPKRRMGQRGRAVPIPTYVQAVNARFNGMTYKSYQSQCAAASSPYFCKSVYHDICARDLHDACKQIWNQYLEAVTAPAIRKAYQDYNLYDPNTDKKLDLLIEIDTCFNKRGWDSLDSITIARDVITGFIVGKFNMHRNCPVQSRTQQGYDVWFPKSSS